MFMGLNATIDINGGRCDGPHNVQPSLLTTTSCLACVLVTGNISKPMRQETIIWDLALDITPHQATSSWSG